MNAVSLAVQSIKNNTITDVGMECASVATASSPLHRRPDGFVEQPASVEQTDRLPGRTAGDGQEEGDEGKGSCSDSEDDESDLFVNTNRPDTHYSESEEEEEGESGEDSGEERTVTGS